jgi:hypothetical protein
MYNKAAYINLTESIMDHVYADRKDVVFNGVVLDMVSGLEIAGSDDGIEFLITDIESGDEYGVVCANMTAAQMQTCIDAANEMYATYTADLLVSAQDKAAAEYNFWF